MISKIPRELYENMSKNEKAKWIKNQFISYFADNPFTRDNYEEVKNVYINEKRTSVSKILVGFKKNKINQEEENLQ